MKKIIIALVSIALTTATSFAGNHHQGQAPVAQPKTEAQHKPHHDPVVDMDIIKNLGLSPKKVQQIEALQQRKHQEMVMNHPKDQHGNKHHQKPQNGPKQHGQHNPQTTPQKGHHNAQMKTFKDDYRKELCNIMGKDKYIAYLQMQNDKMAHRHGGNKTQGKAGQHQHGAQPGPQFNHPAPQGHGA